jgi:hypothetical protein
MNINALQVISPKIPLGEDFTVAPTNDSIQVHNQRGDVFVSLIYFTPRFSCLPGASELPDAIFC